MDFNKMTLLYPRFAGSEVNNADLWLSLFVLSDVNNPIFKSLLPDAHPTSSNNKTNIAFPIDIF